MLFTKEEIENKKLEITIALGLELPPVNLTPAQTGHILDTSINTLSVWRSTGRYNLPHVKISRRVAYPLTAVAEFLLKREMNHTGDVEL